MSQIIREGTPVAWQWGNGYGEGKVIEIFKHEVTRMLEGNEVTRNGTDDNPAYLIEQEDGSRVLKLRSEIEINR